MMQLPNADTCDSVHSRYVVGVAAEWPAMV